MTGISFAIEMALLTSAVGFILCLRFLGSPTTAKFGNNVGFFSMFLAVLMTFFLAPDQDYIGILAFIAIGSAIGVITAKKVKMTDMPQMVAMFNGLGGGASVLVAAAEMVRYCDSNASPGLQFSLTSWFSVVVGAVTLTGSLIAYGKLQEIMTTKPILFTGQRVVTLLLFLVTIFGAFILCRNPLDIETFIVVSLVSLVLGVLLVIPIGGADMPVVISLLNSYSGVAAMAAGFAVDSRILIVSGSLVGASGIILTRLMCEAMNRSLLNVIFGAFGATEESSSSEDEKPMREYLPADAAMLLTNADQVIVVPGYGLAVSQAQHNIREIADLLKDRDIKVKYAIHPVAGRMPGHMNVLLAEADISYEDLYDLEQINPEFENTGVVLIIGANDVVNPLARTDKTCPLYGMPILNADKAQSIIIFKRGRGKGFAGVENPLFTLDKSGIIFGDAKKSLISVANEVKNI